MKQDKCLAIFTVALLICISALEACADAMNPTNLRDAEIKYWKLTRRLKSMERNYASCQSIMRISDKRDSTFCANQHKSNALQVKFVDAPTLLVITLTKPIKILEINT